MSDDFQPNWNDAGNNTQQQQAPSSGTGNSEPPQTDARQNDIIAAEIRRLQQAREDENNALMQLLSQQQLLGAVSAGTPSSGSQFNSTNTSASNSFGSNIGDINSFNNFLLSQMNPQMNMNNDPFAAAAAASSSSSQFNQQFNSLPLNSQAQLMNSMLNGMAAGGSSSLPSQFNQVDALPFGNSQMMNNLMASSSNIMSNQGGSMDPLGLMPNPFMGGALSNEQPPANREDAGWDDQYKALCAYRQQFGNCKVPARFKANPKLGRWVMTQRRQFTLLMQGFPSALTTERIRRLEDIGFTWSVRPEPAKDWNKKLEELKGKSHLL
jgi:hypothetical protein